MKKRKWSVDFQQIENKAGAGVNGGRRFNDFERQVYDAMQVDDWQDTFNRIDKSWAFERLTEKEQKTALLYAKLGTQQKVADRLGLSQQAISYRLKIIRDKLRADD